MINSQDARFANWISSGFAIAILLLRLASARNSSQTTAICKALCVISIIIIIARLPIIYQVLQCGTVANALSSRPQPFPDELEQLKIGSVLTLIARLLATSFYWLQTALLLRFYTNVIGHIEWCRKAIRSTWIVIILTYIASVLSIFLECRPFRLYWQFYPSVDQCTRAYGQIFTQGILNIALDLILLVISIPLWTGQKFTISQTVRVGVLLITGTFCMIVTGVKLDFVVGANSHQNARTFWASIQILVSTFVANAPTIYGSLRLMIRRRQEKKTRRSSRPDDWPALGVTRTRTREDAPTSMTDNRTFTYGLGLDSTDKVGSEHQERV